MTASPTPRPSANSCARNLPQHFNGCACRPKLRAAEAVDVDLVRAAAPSRDFSDVGLHTPIPGDIGAWDVVDRVAFYDAKQAATDAAFGGPATPTPARQIELNWSDYPTHPAEPAPAFPVDPRYVATGTGRAQCPGCTGTGGQFTAIGDRVCFLCSGDGEVRQETAKSFISDVRKAYGRPESEPDFEEISQRRFDVQDY